MRIDFRADQAVQVAGAFPERLLKDIYTKVTDAIKHAAMVGKYETTYTIDAGDREYVPENDMSGLIDRLQASGFKAHCGDGRKIFITWEQPPSK